MSKRNVQYFLIPYIQAGEEILRTTKNENGLDWDNKTRYYELLEYDKGLIALKKHTSFSMKTRDHLKCIPFTSDNMDSTISYLVKNPLCEVGTEEEAVYLWCVFNANGKPIEMDIPSTNSN